MQSGGVGEDVEEWNGSELVRLECPDNTVELLSQYGGRNLTNSFLSKMFSK